MKNAKEREVEGFFFFFFVALFILCRIGFLGLL